MRIYVAAPWVYKTEAIAAGKQLEAAGHHITSRWFYHDGSPEDTTGSRLPRTEALRQVTEDLEDVLSADMVIVLNLKKSEGKAVETGVAIHAGIPFISVGPRSTIFQTLGTEVDTLDDAISYLSTLL